MHSEYLPCVNVENDLSDSARWQRRYRDNQRERGYELVSHYVPTEYADLTRKLLRIITPRPNTKAKNKLLYVLKLLELISRGHAVLSTESMAKLHIDDFGLVHTDHIKIIPPGH